MKVAFPWPADVGGRTMIVLLAAVMSVHLGSILVYQELATDAARDAHMEHIIEHIATVAGALPDQSTEIRDKITRELSSRSLTLRWDVHPSTNEVAPDDADLRAFRKSLAGFLPETRDRDILLARGNDKAAGTSRAILGALRLPDKTFLNFSVPALAETVPGAQAAVASTTLMAIGVVLASLLVVRSLVRPLRVMAVAADAIGSEANVTIPETGSEELRLVARSFNAMQARINRVISDRTQALAAMSHDLRTPITRLRLRAGFVEDKDAQTAIDADLDEMEAMIDATLAYLRRDADPEKPKITDLTAIIVTLVDAATDAGRSARYDGPRHVTLTLRPMTIKRAFANLIDNALFYGGATRVTVHETAAEVRVTVDDDGPGVPESELERVFEPFQRLEASRNRRTGGAGLGLAIARQAIEREGGTVRLTNRTGGGLRAEVIIPVREHGKEAPRPQPASHSARPSNVS